MLRLGLATILAIFTWTSVGLARTGSEVGNGGDAIETGGATKIFDEVEYDQAFLPDTTGEAWSMVDGDLTILAKKLPQTANYLRSVFSGGTSLWWFVSVQLKDIADEGPTDVVITFEKEQIAANKDGVVQIRHDLWDKLTPRSQAVLLMHEALWTAIGAQNIDSGAQIRQLSALLLSDQLQSISTVNLAKFIHQFIGPAHADAKLYALVDYDLMTSRGDLGFSVEEVTTDRSVDTVAKFPATASEGELWLTTLNPSPLYPFIYADRNRRLYTDLGKNGRTTFYQIGANDLCDSLDYAGTRSWRLPSAAELLALYQRKLLQARYIPASQLVRSFGKDPGTYAESAAKVSYLFPADPRLVLLTQDLTLLDISGGFANVTDGYQPPYAAGEGLIYPRYFCVKSVQ